MARTSRPTFRKRQKELARQQRAKDKQARRMENKERRAAAAPRTGDEDPDIAGIVPGPQPLPPEWEYVLGEENPEEGEKEESSEEKKAPAAEKE
jgi:hypothetical protein